MFSSSVNQEVGAVVESVWSNELESAKLFLQDEAEYDFAKAKALVRALIGSPVLDDIARTAFGANVTGDQLATVIEDFDRSGWPQLRLGDLEPGHGAYAALKDTIYLGWRFVYERGSVAVQNVLVHEIGHAIDHRLGGAEAVGDEGAIFAALVGGESLTPVELAALRGADDEGTLVVDGQYLRAEFAGTYGSFKVDGSFSDWPLSDRLDTTANAVTGYALYGTFAANTFLIGIQSTTTTNLVIGPGTTIWLNTDQNRTTGYNYAWGFTNVGAEYNITFDSAGTPYLYTGAAAQTLVSATPLDFAFSADGKSLEIALPSSLITPPAGTAPTAIDMAAVIDNSTYLPGDFSTARPEYTIKNQAQTYGSIAVDGSFSDWSASNRVDNAANAITGYAFYGTVAANTYVIGIQSTSASNLVIGAGTTIWLNTDQNRATGYNYAWGFNNVGAEYNITFDGTGTPYLYTGAAGQTLVSAIPLNYALSADGRSLEIALPSSLITATGGTAPTSVSFVALIDNSVYLPGDYSAAVPEYTVNDPAANPPQTYGSITVDGSFADWNTSLEIDTAASAVTGYALYGTVAANTYLIGIQSTNAADLVIGAGTTLWLNTDQNRTTGYNLSWGFTNVGAEYNVTFDSTGKPYLYTGAAGQTLVSPTALNYALSADGKSLEIAIPRSLVTPVGGTAPKSIDIAGIIDNSVYLPTDYSTAAPQYTVKDPAIAAAIYGPITIDGVLTDWITAQRIDQLPGDAVTGYALYGTAAANNWLIAIQATVTTDPSIGPGTTLWLNTDLNRATGYSLWGFTNVGADYNITFNSAGTPFLYTGAAGQTLVSTTPLNFALSPDGKSLEIAIPQSLLIPVGGIVPASIDIAAQISAAGAPASVTYLPGDYTNVPQYLITDPASQHRVAIVYSDTSAARYFSQSAYSDLFMAAQNQARMAGVSYDVIDESKLTDINNLVGYDALIFPNMTDVNAAQLPAIMSTLTAAVYKYGIGIITAGDFLTNDENGTPFAGNPYANMTSLLNLTRLSGGNSAATVTVTATDTSNPIMAGYTPGQVIGTYSNEGYTNYAGVTTAADVLASQTVTGVTGAISAVVETTTGGKNVVFSSADLFADGNLLSHAIQSVVSGPQPGLTLHTSRQAAIVAARMDMDQSQFPSDVSPTNGTGGTLPGIYDKLLPILQQWKTQYNFVGSYYINIGNTPTAADPTGTNWTTSLPYYHAIQALGGEIGNHSYTHLVNPPATATTAITATTVGDTPAGSTSITLSGVPAFAGTTLGLIVGGSASLGANVVLPGTAGEAGAVANTTITAINGNTITVSFQPGGYGTGNSGTLADIPAGTKLTFTVPSENTNFLQTTGTVLSGVGAPFTYDYEFNQSKLLEQTQLGTTIYGAAVPGAPEAFTTSQNILQYYPSTSTYTGYLTGGYTGIGAGYPSAIGYMTPGNQSTIYIAPNVTFDFTEIQYEGKTIAQAEADWAAQVAALTANAAGTPVIVWPIHDYAASAWDTSDAGQTPPYTTQMFTDFIANAAAANDEFVTLEELASRIAAQEKASITYTSSGNTIIATVTPDPTAPDLGEMALSVVNGGTSIIQNAGSWYAYNTQELFVPRNGGSFTVTLGTVQDDVTHIANLPSRADLLSVTGDGTNLSFSMTGDGNVLVDLKNPATSFVSIQGAPSASLTGDQLTLMFADTLVAPTYTPIQHNVSIQEGASIVLTALNEIVFGTAGNDTFRPAGSGADTYYGDGGTDTMVFSGPQISYQVTLGTGSAPTIVTDLRAGAPDGIATLYGIANLVFGAAPPTVSTVVASGTGITNGSGLVGLGGAVTLTLNFSVAVTVAGGTPTLTLNDGGAAAYTGGSGTTALTFSYTTATGQTASSLAVSQINLPTGTTIQSAVGLAAALTPVPALSGTLQIDTTPPTVASIAASGTGLPNGTGAVGAGAVIIFTETFNEAVNVTGTPTLTLSDGGTATYASGSGTMALTFTNTVLAGQSSPDLTVTAASGGTIADLAGNSANLAGAVVNPAGTLQVITAAPTVTSIATSGTGINSSGTGAVGAGTVITFTETFSSAVTVAGGTPTLTLSDGDTASYLSGSGTMALTFTNTVSAGRSSSDLTVTAVNLGTATIRDIAGNNANLAGAVGNPNGTLQVITAAPTVTLIATSGTGITGGTGSVGIGTAISFTETFSSAVTVAGGTPTLTLSDGDTATYASGSGTTMLTFINTVSAGRSSSDLTVTAANLGGATIRDIAGNNANLAGAVGNPAGILQVVTRAPTISSITTSGTGITSGAGYLNAGKTVTFTVTMSAAVTVAGGTPSLTLNDNGAASYLSGSGTNVLTFSYPVAAGQNTTDLIVNTVALNGATIKDAAGNSFVPPGTTTNPTGTLVIDTIAPTITVSTVASNGTVTATKAANGFAITGTTGGTGGVENGQVASVQLLTASKQVAATVTGSVSGNSWTANVTSAQAKALSDGSFTAVATVSDKAGNPATSTALAFTVNEGPRVPTLTLASTTLKVNAGGSVSLGVSASSVSTADLISVTIRGVPTYETITAPAGYTVSSVTSGSTKTWTVKQGTAGTPLNGLVLASSYTGTGSPVANFTITATSTAGGQTATSASQAMAVTDPPAGTVTTTSNAVTKAAQLLPASDLKSQIVSFVSASAGSGGTTLSTTPPSAGSIPFMLNASQIPHTIVPI